MTTRAMARPGTVWITRAVILLNGLLWLVFALVVAAGIHPSYGQVGSLRWPMALAAVGTACALLALAWLLRTTNPLVYWGSVILLAAIVLVGLFDEVGVADVAFLVVTSIPLALLVKDRRWYLRPASLEKPQERAG